MRFFSFHSFWLCWFRELSSKERNTSSGKYEDPIELEVQTATWPLCHQIHKEEIALSSGEIDTNYKSKIGLLLHIRNKEYI